MKTNNKNLFLKILVTVLFLSAFSPSFGQNMYRGVLNESMCDTSIVRETSKDTVLIYNRRNKTSTFMLVPDNTTSNPWTIYFDDIYINDFEIFEKNVYFCGYTMVEDVKNAVFGYLPLIPFPSSDLYCYITNECKEFKKLDVYETVEMQFAEETHLVIIGTTNDSRSDALVDVSMFSPLPYNFSIHISLDENENYDDVAVTKNKVVVSSRNKVKGIPIVNFLYYDRPLLLGQNIFSSLANRLRTSSPAAETPVFLEHTQNDSVAAVFKVLGYSRIAMLNLEVSSANYKSYEITVDSAETVIPIDIKYNTRNYVYGILARTANSYNPDFLPQMQIYHVSQADLNNLTPYGNGTKYTERVFNLWSLEPLRKTANYFVASGDEGNLPRLFKFNHYQWDPCSTGFNYLYAIGYLLGKFEDIDVLCQPLIAEFKKIVPWNKKKPFPVLCPTQNEAE